MWTDRDLQLLKDGHHWMYSPGAWWGKSDYPHGAGRETEASHDFVIGPGSCCWYQSKNLTLELDHPGSNAHSDSVCVSLSILHNLLKPQFLFL